MEYQEKFLADFSEWIDQQIFVSDMAMKAAEKVATEDNKPEARDAVIRYESRLDAYKYIQEKFENYKNGKEFHHMPDLGTRKY